MSLNCQMVFTLIDYIEHIIKKHETLTIISPIHIYINNNNKRFVFKIKDGYNLKLQMPETRNYLAAQKN